jgi:putative Mg2+ transporter-C (MgtC) family protein
VSTTLAELGQALRLSIFLQLSLAVLLGGAIGFERESRGKPAGLRTNILICMGATLFTLLSYRLAPPGADAGRVAAQVVSGIGFLGAGTILHARGTVVGLTSAATIWLVAAIGMAIGSHSYIEALGATALAMVVLDGLGFIEGRIAARSSRAHLTVSAAAEPGAVGAIEGLLRDLGLRLEECHLRRDESGVVLEVDVVGPKRLHGQARVTLLESPAVKSVSMSETVAH